MSLLTYRNQKVKRKNYLNSIISKAILSQRNNATACLQGNREIEANRIGKTERQATCINFLELVGSAIMRVATGMHHSCCKALRKDIGLKWEK